VARRRTGEPRGSAAWRDRVAGGVRQAAARRRERLAVRPAEVAHFRREGLVADSLAPLAAEAEREVDEIRDALGGTAHLAPQELALLRDYARLGIVLFAELGLYLADPKGNDERAGRVSTLSSARRALLKDLGLKRREKPVPSLADYLAERAAAKAAEQAQEAAQERGNGPAPAQGRPGEGEIAGESASTGASWDHGARPGAGPDAPEAAVDFEDVGPEGGS